MISKMTAEVRGNPYTIQIEWENSPTEEPYIIGVSMIDPLDGSRMRTNFTFGEIRSLRRLLEGLIG